MPLSRLRQDWLSNIRGDLLAGIVVALALIPEAIAFSIIAGALRLGALMRYVSRSVVTGFVNALAILIYRCPNIEETEDGQQGIGPTTTMIQTSTIPVLLPQ